MSSPKFQIGDYFFYNSHKGIKDTHRIILGQVTVTYKDMVYYNTLAFKWVGGYVFRIGNSMYKDAEVLSEEQVDFIKLFYWSS